MLSVTLFLPHNDFPTLFAMEVVFCVLMSSVAWMKGNDLVSGRTKKANDPSIMTTPKMAGGRPGFDSPPSSTMYGEIVVPI